MIKGKSGDRRMKDGYCLKCGEGQQEKYVKRV